MVFPDLGGKFEFFAQDSDLEYLFWRSKNSPLSSDLKPPLWDSFRKNCVLIHTDSFAETVRTSFNFEN